MRTGLKTQADQGFESPLTAIFLASALRSWSKPSRCSTPWTVICAQCAGVVLPCIRASCATTGAQITSSPRKFRPSGRFRRRRTTARWSADPCAGSAHSRCGCGLRRPRARRGRCAGRAAPVRPGGCGRRGPRPSRGRPRARRSPSARIARAAAPMVAAPHRSRRVRAAGHRLKGPSGRRRRGFSLRRLGRFSAPEDGARHRAN